MRAQQLNQKLVNLQSGLESEVNARRDAFEFKTKQLEDKMHAVHTAFDGHVGELKDAMGRVAEATKTEDLALEVLDDRKTKEAKSSEKNTMLDADRERQNFKETHGKLERTAEEKLFELRLELNKEKKMREEAEESQLNEFTDDILKLQEAIDHEISSRELSYERIVRSIGQELSVGYEKVEKQTRARAEVHSNYSKTIEELEDLIRHELQKERAEREHVEETLIKLLEETCERVEQGLHAKRYS